MEKKAERLRFRLEWDGDEVCWPWPFSFETSHTLEGRTLRTACTAVNLSSRAMPVQLGFHPGLRCPFSSEYGIQDYCIRFEKPEISGGTDTLDLTPALFDHDSICFTNLRSDWLQLEERKTGRYLRVYTQGFPYVLLWSRPGIPGWVCIEPWTGYTGPGHMLSERPGDRPSSACGILQPRSEDRNCPVGEHGGDRKAPPSLRRARPKQQEAFYHRTKSLMEL